jgi:predicted nuclease of predicted toxin-antitoxin system
LRFLVDRCAGRRLADWLRSQGHDVVEVRATGRDPGDAALLRRAADDARILVTIDTDFGALIHLRAQAHAGLIRLPDVPAARRIELMAQILADHAEAELSQVLVTIKGSRIRISRQASAQDRRPARER